MALQNLQTHCRTRVLTEKKLYNVWTQKASRPARELFLTDQFIQFLTELHSTSQPLTVVLCDPLTLRAANRTQTVVMA